MPPPPAPQGSQGNVVTSSSSREISTENSRTWQTTAKSAGSIFGDSGVPLFNDQRERGGGTGIGVNVFLWRATLDTTSFVPLLSADPFGGVIITDWYLPIESPNERFKLTIYILDKQLRADGLKISLFKQKRNIDGNWVNTKFDKNLVRKLEDTILSRARELKIASIKPK